MNDTLEIPEHIRKAAADHIRVLGEHVTSNTPEAYMEKHGLEPENWRAEALSKLNESK